MRTLALALATIAVGAGVAAAPASAQTPPDPPPVVTLDPSQLIRDRVGHLLLKPDLTIAGLDLDRSRGKLTVSVQNLGLAAAPASVTRVKVSLRNPITYMARTVRIVDVPTRPLAFRQIRELVVDLDGHPGADYPVSPFLEMTVIADATGAVAESDEGNNAAGILGRRL
ncbi:MAG TPA: hypothetical protein VN213_16465 [Solirubrobacteraceae bacterium]|nr:hypothetical protein [Solirubrobacteraceae bacterium]